MSDDLSVGLSSLFAVALVVTLAPIIVGPLARYRTPQAHPRG